MPAKNTKTPAIFAPASGLVLLLLSTLAAAVPAAEPPLRVQFEINATTPDLVAAIETYLLTELRYLERAVETVEVDGDWQVKLTAIDTRRSIGNGIELDLFAEFIQPFGPKRQILASKLNALFDQPLPANQRQQRAAALLDSLTRGLVSYRHQAVFAGPRQNLAAFANAFTAALQGEGLFDQEIRLYLKETQDFKGIGPTFRKALKQSGQVQFVDKTPDYELQLHKSYSDLDDDIYVAVVLLQQHPLDYAHWLTQLTPDILTAPNHLLAMVDAQTKDLVFFVEAGSFTRNTHNHLPAYCRATIKFWHKLINAETSPPPPKQPSSKNESEAIPLHDFTE